MFKKKKTDATQKDWYMDRYQTVLTQRNLFMLATVAALVAVIVAVLVMRNIVINKEMQPYVIELDKKTGITSIVRPFQPEQISQREAIDRYFVMKYLNARETYNPGSYQYNYYTLVQFLSSKRIYSEFIGSIDTEKLSVLGNKGKTIKVKKISLLQSRDSVKTAKVRLTQEMEGSTKHLIATINYVYADFEMSSEQRAINPLGFQVTGYQIDEEVF